MSDFYTIESEEIFRRQLAYWQNKGYGEIFTRFLILYILLPVSALLAQAHVLSAIYTTMYVLLLSAQALVTIKFRSINQVKHANVRAENKTLLLANFSIAWLLVLTLLFLKISIDTLPNSEFRQSTSNIYLAAFTAIMLISFYWAPKSYPKPSMVASEKQKNTTGFWKFFQTLAIWLGVFMGLRGAAKIDDIQIILSFLIFLGSCLLVLTTILAAHRTVLVLWAKRFKRMP